MSGGRLLWVAVLAAVYLLTLGSADPLDLAFGVVLAVGLWPEPLLALSDQAGDALLRMVP